MDFERLHAIAYETMGERSPQRFRERGYVYYHCRRVAKIAVELRKRLGKQAAEVDKDVLYAAGLLHDAAKGVEPHHDTGAVVVRYLLRDVVKPKKAEAIAELIAGHNQRQKENLPVGVRILQDADVLDHYGSQEIWLQFLHAAYGQESVDDVLRRWDSDEYEAFTGRMRGRLNFDISQELFDEKIEYRRQFQKRFALECEGELP